ncbi:MAG: PTS system mannose/fructose/sorbose family transporter subunit IID, partial [Tissierellia bacterium]|nr:PTS system mannose/fructose/sorbose family transporter subunit IID [Tissierellia bacterium]
MTISNKNNEDMINKKDLKKMALNSGSLGMEFSWNYERQMNIA